MSDFSSSPYDVAPASSGRFAGYAARAGSTDYAPYANVFADVSNLYLPKSVKSLFRWCEYFAVMDPLVHAAVTKISAYPITDLAYLSKNEWVNKTYRHIFEDVFQIRAFEVETLLDYHTYGNAFVYVHHPLRKILQCESCKEQTPLESTDYTWSGYKFLYTCPKCEHMGYAKVKDQYIKSARDLRLIRVNPNYMEIEHNPSTGRTIYSYTIPPAVTNAILVGRKDTLSSIPQAFIEATARGKRLVFKPGTIFHLKRTSISRHDSGWGLPLISPTIKTAFYYRILLKAQEAIALEHIVPLRMFFPQTSSKGDNPYTTYNLVDWQDHIKSEISMWRRDNNYMPVMPYPVGHQVIGGQGKMLLLHNEVKLLQEQILAGMGVPSEFVFGGLRWSGASVSMRTMENSFLRMREDMQRLLEFIVRDISNAFGLPICEIKQKPFRMADDLQKAAFDLQLFDRKLLSAQTMLQTRDYDYEKEQEKRYVLLEESRKVSEREATNTAEINGEAGLVQAKYQAQQQKLMQEAQPPQQVQPGQEAQPGQPTQPAQGGGQPQQQMAPAQPGQPQPAPGQPQPDPMATQAAPQLPPEVMQSFGLHPSETPYPPAAPEAQPVQPPSSPQLIQSARHAARSILALPKSERPKAVVRLRNLMPDLYPLVLDELNDLNTA